MSDIQEIIQKKVDTCSFCLGRNIVKRGKRKKKHEEVRIYFCKDCKKKFTPLLTRNKQYPLIVK